MQLSKEQLKQVEEILDLMRPETQLNLEAFKEICLLEVEEVRLA
jgi:hypothetical protein